MYQVERLLKDLGLIFIVIFAFLYIVTELEY